MRNSRKRGVVFGHCLAPARRVRLVVRKKVVFLCTLWAPNDHKSFLGCREHGYASLIKKLRETEQGKSMYAPQLVQSRRRLTPRVGNARTESEVARNSSFHLSSRARFIRRTSGRLRNLCIGSLDRAYIYVCLVRIVSMDAFP